MQFSIDKERLEDFRSRFKVAIGVTNEAFDQLRKAETAVEHAEHNVSRIEFGTRTIRGSREQREAAEQSLIKARGERDKADKRYVEASRLSGYFGPLFDRCKKYADAQASAEGSMTRARMEDAAVAVANAAYAARAEDEGGRQ